MKRQYRADLCLILCGVLLWFLSDAQRLRQAAFQALCLCAQAVIPALFPFMAVSGMLMEFGIGQWLSPSLAGLMTTLFHLPGPAGSALLLGLIGGYPIGARTAVELYSAGHLTRSETERLLTFCNNANPVFFISVLGQGIFGSGERGIWLWLIHVLSALLTGLFFCGRRDRRQPPAISFQTASLPHVFVSSVKSAAENMISVCAFVLFFYVLVSPFSAHSGPLSTLAVGICELFSLTARLRCDRLSFLLAAGCSGWGGLSVLCQTAALLDGTDLSLRPCVLGKLTQGLLSAALALPLSALLF